MLMTRPCLVGREAVSGKEVLSAEGSSVGAPCQCVCRVLLGMYITMSFDQLQRRRWRLGIGIR